MFNEFAFLTPIDCQWSVVRHLSYSSLPRYTAGCQSTFVGSTFSRSKQQKRVPYTMPNTANIHASHHTSLDRYLVEGLGLLGLKMDRLTT